MGIKFKDPKVRLIAASDNRNEVWRISRPHLQITDKELMDIRKVDLPVHSFAFVTFEITGSLLLRDVLYHVRPSSDWARSNRTTVINKDTLFYSSEYQNGEIDEERWKECVDESVNLDIRKDKFPYAVSTDFCWGCDLRTCATVLHSMKAELPAVWDVYGELFLKALGDIELPPSRSNYFSTLATTWSSSSNNAIVKKDDDFDTVMISYRGMGSLLSQFIRQHISRVRSSLITDLMKCEDIWDTSDWSQDQLFDMQVITNKEGALKLISTRACWFAKFDMQSRSSWSDIITALMTEFKMDLNSAIPCKGDHEKCPWKTEQLARCIAGNPKGSTGEVNPPCPYITGIPELVQLREAKFGSNSSLFNFWKNNLPNNLELTEHGLKYLNNVKLYGFAEECDNKNESMKEIAKLACDKRANL